MKTKEITSTNQQEPTLKMLETAYDGDSYRVNADEDGDVYFGIYGDLVDAAECNGHRVLFKGALVLTVDEAEKMLEDLQSAITEAKNYTNKGVFR